MDKMEEFHVHIPRDGRRRTLLCVLFCLFSAAAIALQLFRVAADAAGWIVDQTLRVVSADVPAAEGGNSVDFSILAGCWDWSADMMTSGHGHSENKRSLKWWGICFNDNGTGDEKLIYVSGITCQSTLTVQFGKAGKGDMRLRFADTGNIPCDRYGQSVYKIEAVCTRIGQGLLDCAGEQPETENKLAWEMRRRPDHADGG